MDNKKQIEEFKEGYLARLMLEKGDPRLTDLSSPYREGYNLRAYELVVGSGMKYTDEEILNHMTQVKKEPQKVKSPNRRVTSRMVTDETGGVFFMTSTGPVEPLPEPVE